MEDRAYRHGRRRARLRHPGKPWQVAPRWSGGFHTAQVLVGREEALERIAWVVSGARAGRGGALMLRGDPGSGKTALLTAAADRAESERGDRGERSA